MTDRKPPPRCLAMALQFGEHGYPIFPAKLGLKESHKRALYSGGVRYGATIDLVQIRGSSGSRVGVFGNFRGLEACM
jgi:hypothetical protein